MVDPIPWRYRSKNDLQRIFKIICFYADPGKDICKSEAVNDSEFRLFRCVEL